MTVRTNKAQLDYYNFDKIFSYNGTYNYLIGARGLGKTYGWKKKVISAAIKRGEQFVYLRRYKDELKISKETFFADIFHEFPKWDFRTNGFTAEMSPSDKRDDKNRPWKIIGHFIPLSTAQSRKGVSYPLVTNIGFDEFIIEKGMTHYLPAETDAFNNFYSTVDRNKDKTKVFFMANAVTIQNPYFIEYDIKPDQVGEFITKAHDDRGVPFIVCHFADSAEFKSGVYATRFGQFIAGSAYADYAVNSEFQDNNDNLIGLKDSNARYHYSIETKSGIFSVWIDFGKGEYFIQEKRPKQELLHTLIPEKMGAGKTLLTYNDKMVQYLRTAFKKGNVFFDTPKSRNAFIEIFKR
jgi:Podovirus DNA encapsidation protein (Gp16).